MTKKFIITNRSTGKEGERVVRSAIGFMEPYLQVAASKAGYEVFCLSYNSLRSDDHQNHYCQVAEAVFGNIDLLQIILMDQSIIERITEISERKSGKKHDPKNNPLTVFRLNDLLEDKEFLDLMHDVSSRNKVGFDKTLPFIAERNRREVNLEDFCAQDEGNVVYLRYAYKGHNLDKFRRLSALSSIRFPVALESFDFNDKTVVTEDQCLRKYSTTTEILRINQQAEEDYIGKIVEFYNKHCAKEGLVIKPEHGGAGNGIVFLEPGYGLNAQDQMTLRSRIAEEIERSQGEYLKRYGTKWDSIILQEKVHSLTSDEKTKLPTGDVRVTIINGEVVGYALRYSEKEGALSYALAKNILPDHRDFTPENINYFLQRSASEVESQYYRNLLSMHDAAQEIAAWCKQNGHFHIGVDLLIGRDSEGKYVFCLTECNNITPDCIPETIMINQEVGATPARIDIASSIIHSIDNGRCISFTSAKKLDSEGIAVRDATKATKKEEQETAATCS